MRCQRCGRPVCPECQRQAAVGVQCVDCVQETVRQAPRTVQGGFRPVVTITLGALCVVSWIVQLAVPAWFQELAFSPAIGEVEPYRFLTTAFLHSRNVTHILFNMYALWVTGPFLERALGRWRFTALYLLSAIGGSVGVLVLAGGPTTDAWYTAAIGASGAIFGLFGAMFVVLRRVGQQGTQILVLIGINFALGFIIENIAWQAHLGGLLVGTLVAAAYAFAPRDKRLPVAVATTVLTALVLVGVCVGVYSWADGIGPVLLGA